MVATVNKPSPVVALRHELIDVYHWPMSVVKEVITNLLPNLGIDELNISGRPNEEGVQRLRELIAQDNRPL